MITSAAKLTEYLQRIGFQGVARPDLGTLVGALREFQLLLDSDSDFPSATAMIAGEPVRGSWWTHPKAREMYRLSMQLRDHRDVLAVKLVSGKVTFVHRGLWPG